MKGARGVDDRYLAFSPRPFDMIRWKSQNSTNQNMAVEKRQPTEGRRPSQHVVAREFKTSVKILNLESCPLSGRSSGSLAPRVNSSRAIPRSIPLTTRGPRELGPKDSIARLRDLRDGIMSERLGCPIRPYTVLPGKAFPRTPFAGAKKCEADNKAKSEEAAHLVDLKRAVRLLTCFQLQLNFVCAETEAAILRHREKAEAQLVEGAVATHQLKKNLLAARIQSVKHLKASVNWAMEETSNIGTAIGIRPGKKKIMMKHMQRALEALNALDAIISEKGFATTLTGTSDPPRVSSGKLDLLKPPLERLGGLTDTVAKCQEALVEGENISVLKCGAERPMEAGGDKKKAGGNLKGHRRPLEKIQALVGANIQKQRTLGFLRMQAAQMNVSVDVGGKRESRSQARSNRPVDRLA